MDTMGHVILQIYHQTSIVHFGKILFLNYFGGWDTCDVVMKFTEALTGPTLQTTNTGSG